jgi:hypothetical protein
MNSEAIYDARKSVHNRRVNPSLLLLFRSARFDCLLQMSLARMNFMDPLMQRFNQLSRAAATRSRAMIRHIASTSNNNSAANS